MSLPGISRALLVQKQDVGQAVAVDINQLGIDRVSHYIKWDDATTGGEVTIETADDAAYTGTWSPLKVVPWTGANRQDAILLDGDFIALRHRISSPIIGGTVSTRVVGSV